MLCEKHPLVFVHRVPLDEWPRLPFELSKHALRTNTRDETSAGPHNLTFPGRKKPPVRRQSNVTQGTWNKTVLRFGFDRKTTSQPRFAMHANQQYDSATIAVLKRALDDVFTDPRFFHRRSTSALEIAEHLLAQAASGERDLDRLKASAFNKLTNQ